MEYCWC